VDLALTAVVRPVEGRLLSVAAPCADEDRATLLWHSNGGRDCAPWSGRHRHCPGVEEGFHGPIPGQDNPDRPDLVLWGARCGSGMSTGRFAGPRGIGWRR